MKATGGFILGGTAAFVAIHAFNWIAPPVPETRIHTVKVPEVVTEEAPEPEVKIETKPLPDACETVIDYLDEYTDSAAEVQRDGQKMKLKMESVTKDQLENPAGVFEYQSYLMDTTERMGEHLVILMDIQSRTDYRLDKCRSEINYSNDGEDVAPADGLSGVVPY